MTKKKDPTLDILKKIQKNTDSMQSSLGLLLAGSAMMQAIEKQKEEIPMLSTDILKGSEYYLGDSFKEILGDIKEVPKIDFTFTATELTKTTADSEIMQQTGMMTREEVISAVIQLTQAQKNGENGLLKTDGYANIIGYVELNGRVVAVSARWYSDDRQWHCRGYGPHDWNAGRQFLSRNGSKSLSADSASELTSFVAELKTIIAKYENK